MARQNLPNIDAITDAFIERAEELVVTEVISEYAPMIEDDECLSRTTAQALIDTIETAQSPLDEVTKEVLLQFGMAVGSLTLRRLFQPFQSDSIRVEYQEGSGQTQEDAIRRVRNGLRS